MEGVISRQWRETQAGYWKTYKSRKLNKRWTTALIQKLLQIAWDMWQHRNHALHNSELNQSNILEGNTNVRLQAIYHLGSGSIPTVARILWKHTKKELIALPLAYKQQWIETAIIAQQKQVQQLAGPYQSERRYMQTWAIPLGQKHNQQR